MFIIGSLFLLSLVSATPLSCISMNNVACKVRPEIINVDTNESVFYPFSIKASKRSGSCNTINDPYAKICVSDVIKNLNWHETCKCKCRLNASVCNNRQRWNDDNCWCECKELIDKGVCDKVYAWNPSNCECECDTTCDFGEYLDYENCKCRKRLVDKLVQECNEIVEETSLVKINSTKCKHNSCILYIVLFSIFFTINIGIDTYFVYYKYINRNNEKVSIYDYLYQAKNY